MSLEQLKALHRDFPYVFHGLPEPSETSLTWFSWMEDPNQLVSARAVFAELNFKFENLRKNGGRIICPHPRDIWVWTTAFPLEKTKVVILMDSPTPVIFDDKLIATGFALHGRGNKSWNNICEAVQQRRIFKVPEKYNGYYSANLTPWIRKGVLLLNCMLTIDREASKNYQHVNHEEWMVVIGLVIQEIKNRCPHAGFICMGGNASTTMEGLFSDTDREEGRLSETGHPSPNNDNEEKKFDPKVFKLCQDYVRKTYPDFTFNL